MKKTFLIILPVLAVLSLGSCKKWLDVKPSNQISDEELFKDADGIRIALNGIYQTLGDGELYGRQLTLGPQQRPRPGLYGQHHLPGVPEGDGPPLYRSGRYARHLQNLGYSLYYHCQHQ